MPVYVYGFLTSLGLLFGTVCALREGRRRSIRWYKMFDFILGTAITFFLAGRIALLIEIFGVGVLLKPWKIFTELGSGINTTVGFIFAVAYGLISMLRHKIFNLRFLDAITPGILIMRAFSLLGSTVFGKSTTVFWAIELGEFSLHPLPLYFSLGYYIIYFIIKQMRRNLRFNGQVFLGALTLSIWMHWVLLFVSEVDNNVLFWLYPILGILTAALWSFGHANSPVTRKRRRGLVAGLVQVVCFIVVVVAIVMFFYSRFE